MPVVTGVVFAFLVGVIVWVVWSDSGEGDSQVAGVPSVVSEVTVPTTSVVPASVVPATTPAMPDLSSMSSTSLGTSPSVTSAIGAEPGAVPGDLAVPGRPMQRPDCDGSYITLVASSIGDQATARSIGALLERYPTTDYLRTDQTCSSLRPDVDGEPIYVVYFGPYPLVDDACAARASGPSGAYVKQLSNDVSPDRSVSCP